MQRAIHHHALSDGELETPGPQGGDLPDGLGADDQRQLPLGESHAAIAPNVDMVHRDGQNPDLDCALSRRRRIGDVDKFQLLLGDEA